MLREEDDIRANPQSTWSYDDTERQDRDRGEEVRVGGGGIRRLEHSLSTLASPKPQMQTTAMRDRNRFLAKWEPSGIAPPAEPTTSIQGAVSATNEGGNNPVTQLT